MTARRAIGRGGVLMGRVRIARGPRIRQCSTVNGNSRRTEAPLEPLHAFPIREALSTRCLGPSKGGPKQPGLSEAGGLRKVWGRLLGARALRSGSAFRGPFRALDPCGRLGPERKIARAFHRVNVAESPAPQWFR